MSFPVYTWFVNEYFVGNIFEWARAHLFAHKSFQVLLFSVCIQLNGFKYCDIILVVLLDC